MMCDAMRNTHVSVDANTENMSLPTTHFHRLTFNYLAVSLIFGGNNLGDNVLHPDILISLLHVDNE
jgi:hypothetical protein